MVTAMVMVMKREKPWLKGDLNIVDSNHLVYNKAT
jgi:hypothetical protein